MNVIEVDLGKTKLFSIGQQYNNNALVIHFVNLPNQKNKYIYYKIDDIEEEIPLVSDLFIVSRPLMMHSGEVKAQIITRDENNSTIELTKNFTMRIQPSNYSGIGEDENYPDDPNIKNYFVKIDEKVNSFEELANLVQTKLDNGEFVGAQGPKGEKGDPGEKGEPGDVTEEYRNLASQIAQNASDAQTSATNAQVSATNAQKILDDTKNFVNQTKTEVNQIKTDTSTLKDEANASAVNAKASEDKAKEYADNLQNSTEAISQLKEDLGNYAFYNISYEISKTGVWLNSTGNEIEAGGWSVSDFIKISVGNTYTINGISTPTIIRKYALYDKNRIFTRYIENNVNEHSINVEPTYNECYIRLSIRYDDALKILTARNPPKNDYRINDKLNVKYFGAVGDGSVDDTNIIQYVLNLAEKTGVSVYLPSGKYLITSLEIPANVTLIGENGKMSPKMLCSVLYCTDRNNSAIILNSCSTIKNIAFFYPNQRIVNNYPVTYPETIKLSDTSTTTLVEIDNINLINSYYAINATQKHEKLRVNNVWGYAINKGLFIDGSTDVDIVNNVHFNYNTLRGFYDESVNEEFESFTAKVGVAFQFGRCDTAIIQNIFAYGYRIGMQLITSVTAVNKLPPTYTIFTSISMDTCNYPLWIGNASHVLFDNFVGVSKNHTGDYSDVKACVYIAGGDGICMSNSILTGYGNMINSSGSDILLSNCNIRNFNRAGETGFVIETSNSDIAVNNSLIIGSINRITGFIHGSSNANSITVTGCIIKNISMQGKLIQVDNVDTIVTQGLNTLINSDSVTN